MRLFLELLLRNVPLPLLITPAARDINDRLLPRPWVRALEALSAVKQPTQIQSLDNSSWKPSTRTMIGFTRVIKALS